MRLIGTTSLMTTFSRYIGIDYSGAETPTSSLKGLRVYIATEDNLPQEVPPPASPRKYWTRRGIAEWLVQRLAEPITTLVGIDHGFSFPAEYFRTHDLPLNWQTFLDDFQEHWPTDRDHVYVDFVREGVEGNGAARTGDAKWRRLTELRAGSAKSVFHFDVQGSVAKSTHAGIPWLRFVRRQLGAKVHFWPFDGWDIPSGFSAIAEVYPRLWSKSFVNSDRTQDQQDAFSVSAWLSQADRDGRLASYFRPDLSAADNDLARIEGWILGAPDVAASLRVRQDRRREVQAKTGSRLVLYFDPGTSSMAAHIALFECGASFEAQRISLMNHENQSREFLAINPEGKVPTLLIDGRRLTEVAAILFYLARRFPEASLLPPHDFEAEAQAISWMSFLASSVHPAMAAALRGNEEVEHAIRMFSAADDRLGASKWALQSGYSIADIHLFRLFWRFSRRYRLPSGRLSNLEAHHQRMMARPAIQKTIEIEKLGRS